MHERTPVIVKNQLSWIVSGLLFSFVFLALVLADSRHAANPSKIGQYGRADGGVQVLPFISSRAGFAFHNGYAAEWQQSAAPIAGLDLTPSSSFVGFDSES
jgi:hypothetical protein